MRRQGDQVDLEALLSVVIGERSAAVVLPTPSRVEEQLWSLTEVGSWRVVSVEPSALAVGGATAVAEMREALEGLGATALDVVVLLPPIGRGDEGREDLAVSCLRALIAALDGIPVEILAVVGSYSLASRRGLAELLPLLEVRPPAKIVDLTGFLLSRVVSPSVGFALLELPSRPHSSTVFVACNGELSIEDLGDVMRSTHMPARATDHVFSLPWPPDVSNGLLPGGLHPRRAERAQEAAAIGELVPLRDIASVIGPVRSVRPRQGEVVPSALRTITARAVRASGLETDDLGQQPEHLVGEALADSDILIPAVRPAGQRFRAVRVRSEDLPLHLGQHLLAVRPKEGLTETQLSIVTDFLRSQRCLDQLPYKEASAGDIGRVSSASLLDVRVPLAGEELERAFKAVSEAAADFSKWMREVEQLRAEAIDGVDLEEARSNLLAHSALLRQRAEAARKLDDLGHRVATRFPLPVAYRWRAALAARGGPDEVRSILHAQEVLLGYLAIMAILCARSAGVEIGHLGDLRDRLAKMRGGITLGDWRAILREASDKRTLRRLPRSEPFAEVLDYFTFGEVLEAVQRLGDVRNDAAHLRDHGPLKEADIADECWFDLETLVRAAEFLEDYPLVRVLSTRWDGLVSRNELGVRVLSGDNPIVPREVVPYPEPDVEAGSLYLRDRRGKLHLARPLLIGTECPTCGHWSTFHPDRMTDADTVEFKSLEHGHPLVIPGDESRLEVIGLLASDV
ncbi:MAG: hypothetical protein AAFZ07_07945 [Actinomycetota bacterium]